MGEYLAMLADLREQADRVTALEAELRQARATAWNEGYRAAMLDVGEYSDVEIAPGLNPYRPEDA